MNPIGRWWAVVAAGAVLVVYAALRERVAMLLDLAWPDRFAPEVGDEAVDPLDKPASTLYQGRVAR